MIIARRLKIGRSTMHGWAMMPMIWLVNAIGLTIQDALTFI